MTVNKLMNAYIVKGGYIMRFETEVWEQYSAVQNRAKRAMRKESGNGVASALVSIDSVLEQAKVAGEVELGVCEIPLDQIVGIASDSDKELYTANFMPLPSVKTGFAEKWCKLYLEYLSDKGLAEPIRCYEYMGKFYVIDGKKRVSVLKTHGAMGIKAQITRILPVKTEDPVIQSYYQFVKTFEKTGLYQIAFTQPTDNDAFLEAIGYTPDRTWNDSDRWSFTFHWYQFEKALKLAFGGYLNITTADAVLVLLKNHTFAELKDMTSWALAELLQESWYELYKISNPDFKIRNTAA